MSLELVTTMKFCVLEITKSEITFTLGQCQCFYTKMNLLAMKYTFEYFEDNEKSKKYVHKVRKFITTQCRHTWDI